MSVPTHYDILFETIDGEKFCRDAPWPTPRRQADGADIEL
jgi:hypothetical protein